MSPVPSCFREGTLILCMVNGVGQYLPVETLRKGTLVKTLKNGYVPINAIGSSSIYNPENSLRFPNRLYKCTKNSYPELIQDLYITGHHAILMDTITDKERKEITEIVGKVFVTDRKYRLISCVDKRAEPFVEEGTFKIWHFALENADVYMNYGVWANGLLVETASINFLRNRSGMELLED